MTLRSGLATRDRWQTELRDREWCGTCPCPDSLPRGLCSRSPKPLRIHPLTALSANCFDERGQHNSQTAPRAPNVRDTARFEVLCRQGEGRDPLNARSSASLSNGTISLSFTFMNSPKQPKILWPLINADQHSLEWFTLRFPLIAGIAWNRGKTLVVFARRHRVIPVEAGMTEEAFHIIRHLVCAFDHSDLRLSASSAAQKYSRTASSISGACESILHESHQHHLCIALSSSLYFVGDLAVIDFRTIKAFTCLASCLIRLDGNGHSVSAEHSCLDSLASQVFHSLTGYPGRATVRHHGDFSVVQKH